MNKDINGLISELKERVKLIEFKMELHNKEINRNNESSDRMEKKFNMIIYYIQGMALLVALSEFGLIKAASTLAGIK